jgi:hypothetical protein
MASINSFIVLNGDSIIFIPGKNYINMIIGFHGSLLEFIVKILQLKEGKLTRFLSSDKRLLRMGDKCTNNIKEREATGDGCDKRRCDCDGKHG